MHLEHRPSLPTLPDCPLRDHTASVAERRRDCEALIRLMEDWSHIEAVYAKKMTELRDSIHKILNDKRINKYEGKEREVYESLWSITNIVAVQSKNLQLKIDDDIITEAKETLKKVYFDLSNPETAEKARKKVILSKKKSLEQAYYGVVDRKRVVEEANISKFIIDQYLDSNLEKRMKINKKAGEEESEFRLLEFKYNTFVNEYNQEVQLWSSECNQSLKILEEMGDVYLKIVNDIYMKCQLHRCTEFKTILHELERVEEKWSHLQEEAVAHEGRLKDVERVEPEELASFVLASLRMLENENTEKRLSYSKNPEIKEVLNGNQHQTEDKMQSECKEPKEIKQLDHTRSRSESGTNPAKFYLNLSRFFKECLEGDITEDKFLKLSETLGNNPKRRIDFISFLQRYRIEGRCHLTGSIKKTQRILLMFLDICLKEKDGLCCRLLMVLLFTYFFVVDKTNERERDKDKDRQIQIQKQEDLEKQKQKSTYTSHNSIIKADSQDASKDSSRQSGAQIKELHRYLSLPGCQTSPPKETVRIYLQSLVKDHPIWKQPDYWQSILLECLYEQTLTHRKGARGSSLGADMFHVEHEDQVQKSIVFNQLLAISCNMMLFGRSQKEVMVFANKFIKLFNLGAQRSREIEKSLHPPPPESQPSLLQEALKNDVV